MGKCQLRKILQENFVTTRGGAGASILLQGGKISDGTPMRILYVTYLIHDVNSYINLPLMRFTYNYLIQLKFVNAYKAFFMQT